MERRKQSRGTDQIKNMKPTKNERTGGQTPVFTAKTTVNDRNEFPLEEAR